MPACRLIRSFAPYGLACLLLAAHLTPSARAATERIDFNRDIRPIFSENCYACHGPDQNKREAALRLDQEAVAFAKLESGKYAVVPGDPSSSEVIRRIATDDEDDRMPPAHFGKTLSQEQISLLSRWVKQGARWKGHWAYLAPERPSLPKVKKGSWIRNEIDHFILQRLEQEKLKPSREADRAKLIRRVTLDLTGLPPTIAEVKAFLSDSSADAYEKLVDRLLASPAFGERMALFWLDVARYADTNGYHIDNHRDIWKWREWVIDAFNRNMPFDQFTVEQIAGDLLPNATVEQRVATGFNRNEMVNFEGGADPDEYASKYVIGRVDTTSRAFLGTTFACAECHDHKYDPISQKEFYQFYAFFNTIDEKGLDGSKESPVPRLKVPSGKQRDELARLEREIEKLTVDHKTFLESPDADSDRAQADWENSFRASAQENWTALAPVKLRSSSGAVATNLADQSLLVSGTNAAKDEYVVTLRTDLSVLTGLRLDVFTHDSLTNGGPGRSENGNFVLTGVEATARAIVTNVPASLDFGPWHRVGPFVTTNADEAFTKSFINEPAIDLAQTFDDGKLQWQIETNWPDGVVLPLGSTANSATYITRVLTSSAPQAVEFSFGSDDGVRVWLNGSLLVSTNASRSATAHQEKIFGWLRSGENQVLMKVSNRGAGSAFYFNVLEENVTKVPLRFALASADHSQTGFDIAGVLDSDDETGWAILDAENKAGKDRHAVLVLGQPGGFVGGTEIDLHLRFKSKFAQHAFAHFRVSATSASGLTEYAALPADVRAALTSTTESRDASSAALVRKFYREQHSPKVKEVVAALAMARAGRTKVESEIAETMVMAEMEKPRDTHILMRGDFRAKGDKVTPDVPKIFPRLPEGPANRLAMAKWLVDPANPLVSRVTVNRFWQQYFGNGLVRTADDFGSQGEWPSHPDLLDWLATEFIRTGWDIKAMQKLIVMSATYRQDSVVEAKALERDPENRLLARGPRLRLEAETIRDNALAVSGLLNREMGGPSVSPYQPPGLWEAIGFGNGFTSQSYAQSKGDANYRRGLYTYWKRSLHYASFATFDAPNREVCTVKRPRTNTPLQALVLLNDPVYVEAARALGQRIMQEGGASISEKIRFAFEVCLARKPRKNEVAVLEKIYREQLRQFQADPDAAKQLISVGDSKPAENLDAGELAAWMAIGNILLNVDEMITKG